MRLRRLQDRCHAQKAVAVYAVRARRGAPVAVPLHWEEVRRTEFRPDGVTIQNVWERLNRIQDAWKEFWRHSASLDGARRKLSGITAA